MTAGAFRSALVARRTIGGAALIAEVKARSGQGKDLLRGRDPGELARAYVEGGAACISVVTGKWFGGSDDMLEAVTRAVDVPVLCKDFFRVPADVEAAAARGAAAVLVTLRVVPDPAARLLLETCARLGIDAFVEASTEVERERAVSLGATILAVNNLDILDLERSGEGTTRSLRLRRAGAEGTLWVSASGIDGPDAAAALVDAGYDALLVGTHLLEGSDPRAAASLLTRAVSRARHAPGRPGLLKICGVSREAEIDLLADASVDFAGLCTFPGEAYSLDLERASALVAHAGGRIQPVLVTISRDVSEIARALETTRAGAVQLSGGTTPADVAKLRALFPLLQVIQTLHVRGTAIPTRAAAEAYAEAGTDLFLIDSVGTWGRLGSTGKEVPGEVLDGLRAAPLPAPYLLAGGLKPGTAQERVARGGASGADILSGARNEQGLAPEHVRTLASEVHATGPAVE